VLPLRLLHVNAALRKAARPRQCSPSRVSQSMAVKVSYRLSIVYVGYPAKKKTAKVSKSPMPTLPTRLGQGRWRSSLIGHLGHASCKPWL